MTTKSKGEVNPQMSENVATEQMSARIAWFLAGAYPGGAKRKRAARDFAVSPETVKGWMNGSRPAGRHFDAMVKRWGDTFLNFVYPRPTAPTAVNEMREIADRLGRLEEMIGGEMVGGPNAQLASPESTEADSPRRENDEGPSGPCGGSPRSRASRETLANSVPAPRREVAPAAAQETR